jgi:hypothetical protein
MACCGKAPEGKEAAMPTTLNPQRREFFEALRPGDPSVDPTVRPTDLDQFPSKQPSLGKRASRGLARFLIIFCLGVAATLAWLSYGDVTREAIASSYPQLDWLAPQAAPVAQTAPNMIAPAPPAAPSADLEQLKAISLALAVMRQSVDQLAAGQEQVTRDITKLQAAQQDILQKISAPPTRPAAAPAYKPVPLTPSSQAPPVR